MVTLMNTTERLALMPARPVVDLIDLVRRATEQGGIDPALADALRGASAAVEAELIMDVR